MPAVATKPLSVSRERAIVEDLLWNNGFDADRLTRSRDGVYTYKRSYFYTFGNSSAKIAAKLADVPGITVVDHDETYANWPKTSYFVVRFTYTPQE